MVRARHAGTTERPADLQDGRCGEGVGQAARALQGRTRVDVMLRHLAALLALASGLAVIDTRVAVLAQTEHGDHVSGGTFGAVHFDTSCSPDAQQQFDRAVAMLHSFFYPETEKAFRAIVERE